MLDRSLTHLARATPQCDTMVSAASTSRQIQCFCLFSCFVTSHGAGAVHLLPSSIAVSGGMPTPPDNDDCGKRHPSHQQHIPPHAAPWRRHCRYILDVDVCLPILPERWDRMWLDSHGAAMMKCSPTPAPHPPPPVGLSLYGMGVSFLHLLYSVAESAPDAWQVARAHNRHDA